MASPRPEEKTTTPSAVTREDKATAPSCCEPKVKAACCGEAEKAECCGPSQPAGSCGCR